MIKLPWKREARPLEPRRMVNPKLMELQTAKQILEEIYIIYRYFGDVSRKFDPSMRLSYIEQKASLSCAVEGTPALVY